jgi:hypothetical protein
VNPRAKRDSQFGLLRENELKQLKKFNEHDTVQSAEYAMRIVPRDFAHLPGIRAEF